MNVIRTISELQAIREQIESRGERIGFVPTMGYLHEGHLSLIQAAKNDNDVVVASIFVNPLQFGPAEDFDKYPRDEERDCALADQAGVDLLFIPSMEEMYPRPIQTVVHVKELSQKLCGLSRPGHFDGVATVVLKLLNVIRPHRAYFGQKDAQQVAVVERMVQDLNVPVHIVRCPTLREADGLAMSSRNVYLSPAEREQAPLLYQALMAAKQKLEAGERDLDQLRDFMHNTLRTASLAQIDYVEILSYPDLQSVERIDAFQGQLLLAVAVKFGQARLIDNVIVRLGKEGVDACSDT